MNDFEVLQKQLMRDEGVVLHAYQDSLGFWTIGAGRLIDARKEGGISYEEAIYLLRNDILSHTKAIGARLYWADASIIGAARLGALVNLHFQLGNNLFTFTKSLALMKEGKWEEASVELLNSKWAGQTPQRAKRIAEQIRTNSWV